MGKRKHPPQEPVESANTQPKRPKHDNAKTGKKTQTQTPVSKDAQVENGKKTSESRKPRKTAAQAWREEERQFQLKPGELDRRAEFALYEQLGSENGGVRNEAAVVVVGALLSLLLFGERDGRGDEDVSEREATNKAILDKHLRKLLRGLASGRKAARLGFAIVLTEILRQIWESDGLKTRYLNASFQNVYDILKEVTKVGGPDGAASGQEERDHAIGLIFGLNSFLEAGMTLLNDEILEIVTEDLLELAKTKKVLRELCCSCILSAILRMNTEEEDQAKTCQIQVEKLLEKLEGAGLTSTVEGVGLWISVRTRFPKAKFPTRPWGVHGDPTLKLKELAVILRGSSLNEEGEGSGTNLTGSWNPKLHFAWDVVLDVYAQAAEKNEKNSTEKFETFWKVAVDESLFSESASPERKFWGFLAFQRMLRGSPKLIAPLFSKNLMRCLINHVADKERVLHRAAEKSIEVLLETATGDVRDKAEIILAELIGTNGLYNFDQVTKTKTVEHLLQAMLSSPTQTRHAVQILLEPIKKAGRKDSELRRQVFADHMVTLSRRLQLKDASADELQTLQLVLKTMASLGYTNQDFDPPMTEKTQKNFRSRLSSALGFIINHQTTSCMITELVANIEPNAVEMDEDVMRIAKQSRRLLQQIRKHMSKTKDEKSLTALSLLYALVILELYNGEPDAVTSLEDLELCYEKMISTQDDDMEDGQSLVLMEILLSFSSKPSKLARKAAQQAFAVFVDKLTEEGLSLMMDVLKSSESLRGQQELFENNDEAPEGENESEEDEEEDDGGMDSDVEIVDVAAPDGGSESADESEDEEEEEDGIENSEDEAAQKLDSDLAKILGTHRGDKDLEAASSSDSDADMSDSEMEALDTALSAVLSHRKAAQAQKTKKSETKEAKKNIIDFKKGILELLEIFVKNQPSNPLAFRLLIPLLQLMRTTKAPHITARAHAVIDAFAKASRKLRVGVEEALLDEEDVVRERVQILREIHQEALKNPSAKYGRAASQASLLISSNLYRMDRGNVKVVEEIYEETRGKWVEEVEEGKKARLGFFDDWRSWMSASR